MTLQETLDLLKRNDHNQLYRKSRQVVFRTEANQALRIGLVQLNDDGELLVDLVPDEENAGALGMAPDTETERVRSDDLTNMA